MEKEKKILSDIQEISSIVDIIIKGEESNIIKFYLDKKNPSPYTYSQILSWRTDLPYNYSGNKLERTHDFIQWLFPTISKSGPNDIAETLTEKDIKRFRSDYKGIKTRLYYSLLHFTKFYRFYKFDAESYEYPPPHNLLRWSRILECLYVLGLRAQANWFFDILTKLYNSSNGKFIQSSYTAHYKPQHDRFNYYYDKNVSIKDIIAIETSDKNK
jgi:hypothetical protein